MTLATVRRSRKKKTSELVIYESRWWDSNPRPDDDKGAKGCQRPCLAVAQSPLFAGQESGLAGWWVLGATSEDGWGCNCWDASWDAAGHRRAGGDGDAAFAGDLAAKPAAVTSLAEFGENLTVVDSAKL